MNIIDQINELSTVQLNSMEGPLISKREVLAILSEQKEPCEYTLEDEDSNTWECNKCGELWVLNAGTPKDNNMNYCPKCGREIVS